MLSKIKNNLRTNKKGFTLVEVIVVLVIIAILAAVLIPALIGYIDKANEKKIIAEARSLFIAAQTELSDRYGLGNFSSGSLEYEDGAVTSTDDVEKTIAAAALTLSELSGNTFDSTITYGDDAKITNMTFTSNSITATYNDKADDTATPPVVAGWVIG